MDSFLSAIGYGNFVLVLFVLILVHELGHYLVARACGVKVQVFSVGFGKEIFAFTDKAGTRWRLGLVPFGGYVKMKGEMQAGMRDGDDDDSGCDSFHMQALWKRILVVVAGPAANYLYAIIGLALLFSLVGQPQAGENGDGAHIGAVQLDSAAADSGLRAGDVIVSVLDVAGEQHQIDNFRDLLLVMSRYSGGGALKLWVRREVRIIEVDVIPIQQKIGDTLVYRLGVSASAPNLQKLGFGESLVAGTVASYDYTVLILNTLTDMVKGRVSTDELGGPVRIAQFSKQFGSAGVYAFVYFTVILSINLGLLNLFPIPVLDGGHLLFYIFEAVRGRPVGARIQSICMRVGLFLLIAFMVWVTFNDIMRIAF